MTSTGTGQARNDAGTLPDGELTIANDPRTGAAGPVAKHAWQLVPSSRYRHPGDVIRLMASGLVLIGALAAVAVAPGQLVRSGAPTVTWLGSGSAGRLLIGLVQVTFVIAAAAVVFAVLRYRRSRLLAQLAAGALIAGAALSAILYLAADKDPHSVALTTGQGSWLAGAWFPSPALLATAAAIAVALAPWLSRPWCRTTWLVLSTMVGARLVTGTVLPVELLLALAVGVTVGASVLVAFGVPDKRMGPDGVAEALRSAGLPTTVVEPANVRTKGSRPFVAVTNDGRWLFIKALGSDQRDADLLYRAVPICPAAQRRRHLARRLGHPGGRAPGPCRHVGRAGRRPGPKCRTGYQSRRRDGVARYGTRKRHLARRFSTAGDQRRTAPAAVGRSGEPAPRRDRPSLPAGGERDGRGRR